jgi:predicted ester cyclase
MDVGMISVEGINREVVRKIYDEALNKRNFELLNDLVSEKYPGPAGGSGVAGFRVPISAVLKALPDAHWEIQELIAEGSKVVARWKLSGTHLGQFLHLAPTNRKVVNDGLAIYGLKDGKIVGNHVMTDRLGFQQSLGALPVDLSTVQLPKLNGSEVNFIDRFFVPVKAIPEFCQRMKINREFIKSLPGFMGDQAYEYSDEEGNLICITVALWESRNAVDRAKVSVQAEYKRQAFDPDDMMTRLQIVLDRGVFTLVKE